jgi:hypothetical protein
LTIFGEKWPGSTKYGDIFEALSGSILRVIMNPDQHSSNALQPKVVLESIDEAPQCQGNGPGAGAGSNPVLGAVKEVFMEVDEEVPGGWQGWKMFNEMVQTNAPNAANLDDDQSPDTNMPPERGEDVAESTFDWDGSDGVFDVEGMTGIMPLDSAAFSTPNGWDHGFLGIYE